MRQFPNVEREGIRARPCRAGRIYSQVYFAMFGGRSSGNRRRRLAATLATQTRTRHQGSAQRWMWCTEVNHSALLKNQVGVSGTPITSLNWISLCLPRTSRRWRVSSVNYY